METDFQEPMSGKSDEGLTEYLKNTDKYTIEAIYAAMAELKKRGRIFTDKELKAIEDQIQAKKPATAGEIDANRATRSRWDKNKVDDIIAPKLYTQRTIWGFSTLFTVIFGAVLLSSNIEDRKAKWIVIGFGVLYTSVAIFVLNLLPRNTGFTIAVNAGGAYLLTSLFWTKYIDPDVQYRAKPIWTPLIISVLITILFLLALIYAPKE